MHYPQDAEKIRLVQDNLNTHRRREPVRDVCAGRKPGGLLDKIEFHYTPKHGSWLNMAETRDQASWKGSAWTDGWTMPRR